MSGHTTVLGYFWQAGLVVKTVMLLLLVASVLSWTLILQRAWYFKRKQQEYDAFHRRFWDSSDLNKLYSDIDNNFIGSGLIMSFDKRNNRFLLTKLDWKKTNPTCNISSHQ